MPTSPVDLQTLKCASTVIEEEIVEAAEQQSGLEADGAKAVVPTSPVDLLTLNCASAATGDEILQHITHHSWTLRQARALWRRSTIID